MRSMFFKRSRCRGGKSRDGDRGGGGAGIGGARRPPGSRTALMWPPGGTRAVSAGKQPHHPHGNRHHGGTFTRITAATARSLATAAPPGGTQALSPRQVFSPAVGTEEEGAKPRVPLPPHIHTRLPGPHPT